MTRFWTEAAGRRAGLVTGMVMLAMAGCTRDAPEPSIVGLRAAVSGTIAKVVLTPPADTIVVGGTTQLKATAYASDGSVVQTAFTWSSRQPAIAKVSSTGLVTGVALGRVSIQATAGGLTGYSAMDVVPGGSGGSTNVSTTTSTKGTINVYTATRYQVINGWETTAQAMQGTAQFPLFRDTLLKLAVNDLGINRIRVPVRAGAENPTDYWTQWKKGLISGSTWQCKQYTVVNDDSDPNHINAASFHFSELDSTMEQVVLPFRAKMAAAGKKLYINLNYTEFNHSCGNIAAVHQTPAEYAEFALAAFQHLSQKYGVVPDAWEMILEPDNGTLFTGNATLIGQALGATAARLAAAGFHPSIVGPSPMQALNASPYFDAIEAVASAHGKVAELSYHRYGTAPTNTDLSNIAQRAVSYGIRSAMLEHIGGTYIELMRDLTVARVSAWQQLALAYSGTDDGSKYYVVNTSTATPTVKLGNRTRYLRQFFHYVLPGTTRVGATSGNGALTVAAFQDASGKSVVVVAATQAASFTIGGLPGATYGITYTTAGATGASGGADQTIAAGQLVKASIPAAGVITIFAR